MTKQDELLERAKRQLSNQQAAHDHGSRLGIITSREQRILKANNDLLRDLIAEIERLRQCLIKANDQTEEYERKYYLEVNAKEDRDAEIERLRTALNNISAGVSYERSREIAYAALKGDGE